MNFFPTYQHYFQKLPALVRFPLHLVFNLPQHKEEWGYFLAVALPRLILGFSFTDASPQDIQLLRHVQRTSNDANLQNIVHVNPSSVACYRVARIASLFLSLGPLQDRLRIPSLTRLPPFIQMASLGLMGVVLWVDVVAPFILCSDQEPVESPFHTFTVIVDGLFRVHRAVLTLTHCTNWHTPLLLSLVHLAVESNYMGALLSRFIRWIDFYTLGKELDEEKFPQIAGNLVEGRLYFMSILRHVAMTCICSLTFSSKFDPSIVAEAWADLVNGIIHTFKKNQETVKSIQDYLQKLPKTNDDIRKFRCDTFCGMLEGRVSSLHRDRLIALASAEPVVEK